MPSKERRRTIAKSPRIVPGALASGLVAPRIVRPVLTTSRPSHTMAQTGPEPMSAASQSLGPDDVNVHHELLGFVRYDH